MSSTSDASSGEDGSLRSKRGLHSNLARRQGAHSARRSRGGTDSDSDSNRGSIWDRLNTDRETLEKRNKRLREERRRRELAKCTFQPDISRKKTPRRKAGTASSPSSVDQKREADGSGASRANAKSGRTPRALGDVPVWERLSGVNMSALKVQRDEMKKRREMAECTFQPKLVKPASQAKMLNGDEGNDSTPRKPIWERLYEVRRTCRRLNNWRLSGSLPPVLLCLIFLKDRSTSSRPSGGKIKHQSGSACTTTPLRSRKGKQRTNAYGRLWRCMAAPFRRTFALGMRRQHRESSSSSSSSSIIIITHTHTHAFIERPHAWAKSYHLSLSLQPIYFIHSSLSSTSDVTKPSKNRLIQKKKSKIGSTKKKRIVRRRKPATKSVTDAKKKSTASQGSQDSSVDVIFVPKGKGHSRAKSSRVGQRQAKYLHLRAHRQKYRPVFSMEPDVNAAQSNKEESERERPPRSTQR